MKNKEEQLLQEGGLLEYFGGYTFYMKEFLQESFDGESVQLLTGEVVTVEEFINTKKFED